jgi:hypothetical protein
MNPRQTLPEVTGEFELRFESLLSAEGLSFPCDSDGSVDLDELGDRARGNYLFALIGRDYSAPVVRRLQRVNTRWHSAR